MGSKSKSSSSQSSATTNQVSNLGLEGVDVGGALSLSTTSVSGSNNHIDVTDYGAVAAGVAAARDTAAEALEITREAIAGAATFAQDAGEKSMKMVADMARDQDNVTTETLVKYTAGAVAVAAVAYFFAKGK